MPDWIIWFLIAFVIFRMRGFGGRCGGGVGAGGHHRRGELNGESGVGRASGVGRRSGMGRESVPLQPRTEARRPAPLPQESPMEALQRRFVEGRITVEQYEAELDRHFSRPGNRTGGSPYLH